MPGAIDCGVNTWSNLTFNKENDDYYIGTAGRVSLNYVSDNPHYDKDDDTIFFRVGLYDIKTMPAVLVFQDDKCQENSARFFWDPELESGSDY